MLQTFLCVGRLLLLEFYEYMTYIFQKPNAIMFYIANTLKRLKAIDGILFQQQQILGQKDITRLFTSILFFFFGYFSHKYQCLFHQYVYTRTFGNDALNRCALIQIFVKCIFFTSRKFNCFFFVCQFFVFFFLLFVILFQVF